MYSALLDRSASDMVMVDTPLSKLIQTAMAEKNIAPKDLAQKVGIAYEYARMVVKGDRIPSNAVVMAICRVLDLDFEEVQRLIRLQKIKLSKEELYVLLPEGLRDIAERWEKLSSVQRKVLVDSTAKWTNAIQ